MLIFAVDDEPKLLQYLHAAIAEAAQDAVIRDFHLGQPALDAMEREGLRPDVVFSDIELPGMSGLTLATKIKEAAPNTRIIFATGYDQYALEAYRIHVHGYLMKPIDAAAIREELDQIPHAPKPIPQTLYIQCFGFFDVFWPS